MQKSTALRDAENEALRTTLGANAILELRTGAAPANCAAADTGTLVTSIPLGATPFSASSSGVLSKNGTWEDTAADNGGLIAHYRFKTSGGTCVIQGPASQTGGGGEVIVNNATVVAGQTVTVTAFTFTRNGA